MLGQSFTAFVLLMMAVTHFDYEEDTRVQNAVSLPLLLLLLYCEIVFLGSPPDVK